MERLEVQPVVAGALATLGLAGVWAALRFLPEPFLWIYAIGLALCGVAAARSTAKALWFNLSLPLLVLFGLETWATLQPELSSEGSEAEGYTLPDEVIGYRPARDNRARQRRTFRGEVVYDVVYTIDEHGLRKAPPIAPGAGQECIVFLGGSYTLGEGVADDETLPYQVGLLSGGRYRVYNFGFHGYGPHHMLAALEEGLVAEALECRPRYFIYQGINHHVHRVAGIVFWDDHGPRFVLGDDGAVERRGHFDDGRWKWPAWLTEPLAKSALFIRVMRWNRDQTDADYELFVGVLKRMRRFLEDHYPDSELHVVYWDKPRRGQAIDLESKGFRVHKMTEILPDQTANRDRYRIHPMDNHPTPEAYEKIARYVVREIVTEPDTDAE